MKIQELKNHNKDLAVLIKKDTAYEKDVHRGKANYVDYLSWRMAIGKQYQNISVNYRHHHIAYCLLRGTRYEQIENKVKPGNEPNWVLIETILKQYREVDTISDGDHVA